MPSWSVRETRVSEHGVPGERLMPGKFMMRLGWRQTPRRPSRMLCFSFFLGH